MEEQYKYKEVKVMGKLFVPGSEYLCWKSVSSSPVNVKDKGWDSLHDTWLVVVVTRNYVPDVNKPGKECYVQTNRLELLYLPKGGYIYQSYSKPETLGYIENLVEEDEYEPEQNEQKEFMTKEDWETLLEMYNEQEN